MTAAAKALTLVSPIARARSLDAKPAWWRAMVERETRAHREKRARRLERRAKEIRTEAELVRDALTEAELDERGLYMWADPHREVPGVSPELAHTLRRWDREMSQRTKMRRRLFRLHKEGVPSFRARVLKEAERRIASPWHEQRAGGQRERFPRVASCGTKIRGRLVCRGCLARSEPIAEHCNVALLCQRCRKHRIARYQARMLKARAAAVELVAREYLGPGQAKHDPLRERFLTLTCPHVPLEQGGPERQALLVRTAFRAFMNALRNRWRATQKLARPKRWRTVLALVRFVRCIEFTTGRDELGHVHIHVWILSPFVRAQVVRVLWGRALAKARDADKFPIWPLEHWPDHAFRDKREILDELSGRARAYQRFGEFVQALGRGDWRCALERHSQALAAASGHAADRVAYHFVRRTAPQRVPYPRIDLQLCYGERLEHGGELVSELIKYLCKDFEAASASGDPKLLDPALFAAVYRGLDSGRLISASRQFWLTFRVLCPCCGAWGALQLVQLRPEERLPPPRGPPCHDANRSLTLLA